MNELALYCECSGDTVGFIAVYGQYTSRAGSSHIVAYVGGTPDSVRWRAERILVERAASESVALVSEMGEWSAGRTYVQRPESPEYRPARRDLAGPADSAFDDRIYDLVDHWVCWHEKVLRLKAEALGRRFWNGVARLGPVDGATIAELRGIWLLSMPDPP
jgi:hypothetical protein